MGLDPDPDLMPVDSVYGFNRSIIDATADLVCAYKPNLAFYEALGLKGLTDLERTVDHIRAQNPAVLIIGDAKRGDVAGSSAAYANAMFSHWDFDAVTVNPYVGRDGLQPFLERRERGVFVLCRSSNPGAAQFQDAADASGAPLYQRVAQACEIWNRNQNVGLVAGATYPGELKTLRGLCPDMPFLIPGVGAQSGDLEKAVKFGVNSRGRGAVINSSRGILYGSKGPDFAKKARGAAQALRAAINETLDKEGVGWPSS